MMRSLFALALAGALALPAAAAPIVIVDGDLTRGGVPVTGIFTVTIDVRTDEGTVVASRSLAGLVIEDGLITVPVDLEPALAHLEAGAGLTVDVDLGDDLVASSSIGPALLARAAGLADLAGIADVADLLGDVPPGDLINADDLASVSVGFPNLRNLPPGIDDGVDNGNVLFLTDLTITSGKLEVLTGTITSVLIVDGTVKSDQLADGQISSTHLAALDASRVADGALTNANFTNGAFALEDVLTQNVFSYPVGCVQTAISTEPTCNKRRDGCSATQGRNCTTLACESILTNGATCPGTVIGRLVR